MKIIEVNGISKKYLISHKKQRVRYTALRDVLTNSIKNLFNRNKLASNKEEFWALSDITFDVIKGDKIGIIGKNGAGKSTLLKILSRITEPTAGKIKIKGRVASLLEVGTGFHPELTGRENIYLNGSILGMRKEEIKNKFDEIVEFSEIEKFLDTPVKRYSSGMYVRLAFSVAAHLEPEILLIDEVLAVGDAQFQKKCLGKMEEVSKEGRTILFVSHNMGTVNQLCNKCILLKSGIIEKTGGTNEVIDYYLDQHDKGLEMIERNSDYTGNHFRFISMCDSQTNNKNEFRFDEDIKIKIILFLPDYNDSLELAMRLIDKNKRAVFTIHEKIEPYKDNNKEVNFLITLPSNFLTPGKYSWVCCINHPGYKAYDLLDDIISFFVLETGSVFARYEGSDYGNVFAKYKIEKKIL
jgi:lipopolysaccharide transport system ATP-binding protein